MASRFTMELNGLFGDFWRNNALAEIAKAESRYDNGEMLIDENGVATWNTNGNPIMDDMAEIVEHSKMASFFSRENTAIARDKRDAEFLEGYRKRMENHVYSDEELSEMRAAFGAGTTIVDAFTGKKIRL